MSERRTTQLLEDQAPSGGAFLVAYLGTNAEKCSCFHVNVDGKIDVEYSDTTTASLQVYAGITYYHHIDKFLNTGDTPEIYAYSPA